MKRVTPKLKDVADKAGVSLTAASLIIRDRKHRYSEETVSRVKDIASEMGWRPNMLIEGVQTGITRTIGVLVPPFDSFWSDILYGIQNYLAGVDYMPVTLWVAEDENMSEDDKKDAGIKLLHQLIDRRVDGLILWPLVASAYYQHFKELIDRQLPVVVIDHAISSEKIADSIETDEESGARQVAEHLAALGHKKMLCITQGSIHCNLWAMRRRSSFEMIARSYPDVDVAVENVDILTRDVMADVEAILLRHRDCTAVFCVTDALARAVYHAAQSASLSIPDKLSVVGFADLDYSQYMQPPLTTVRQRGREIGTRAARQIVERATGVLAGAEPYTIRVGCDLIIRGSTGVPKPD